MICIQICSRREWRSLKDIFDVDEKNINTYPLGEYINHSIDGKECIFYPMSTTAKTPSLSRREISGATTLDKGF